MKPELASLYAPPPAARPEHASGLESELLRRFDARPRPSQRWVRSRPLRRLALGTALLAGLAAASQAPVEHTVAVGLRFGITMPPGAPLPPPDIIASAFHSDTPLAPGETQVRVDLRVQRSPAAPLTLWADVWSDASASAMESKLRALPALSAATITVTPLEGQARETLGELLGEQLFNLTSDPVAIAAAREKLQAELAARGEQATVDVEVDDSQPGQKRVMVKVTKDAPAEGASEAPSGR